MKTVSIGNNGDSYPMYLSFKNNDKNEKQLTAYVENDKLIEVGDAIEKGRSTYKVLSIVETREAKGNHPYPVSFQSLIVQ